MSAQTAAQDARPSKRLELIPTIDPATINLSAHAIDRYLERRQWPKDDAHRRLAVERIRALLREVQYQDPPLYMARGRGPSVRYSTGGKRDEGLGFVVDAARTTLITFYSFDAKAAKRKGGHR